MRATASCLTVGTAVRLASLAVVLTLMSGCVGVLPLPTTSNKPVYGHRIERAEVAFIHPGRTTRSKVVEHLGYDYAALPKDGAIAYTWELPGGGGGWWYFLVIPPGGIADGGSWVGGWHAFFVAFDDQDIVIAATFKKPSICKPLHEQLDRWVAKLPATTAAPATAGEPADLPVPNLAGSPRR